MSLEDFICKFETRTKYEIVYHNTYDKKEYIVLIDPKGKEIDHNNTKIFASVRTDNIFIDSKISDKTICISGDNFLKLLERIEHLEDKVRELLDLQGYVPEGVNVEGSKVEEAKERFTSGAKRMKSFVENIEEKDEKKSKN